MGAPDEVKRLVERFDRNQSAYLNSAYNETQLRREFLDPFFRALGWDVDNEAGHAPQYKDVVHEDAIKVGISTRAPDYSFRAGGQRKFFVEAKKPAVSLKDDPAPAYQLRRYAWSGKLPLSVLSDFQEFVVYDCRVKPAPADKASTARTLYVPCADYEERWDEIAGVFSREAIYQGSFDKYAESTKAKKGTAEVDKAFLGEIESWRDALARTIALRNPSLSQHELNYAVQATIDRIIFLRICEDRAIEPYGRLQGLLNGGGTYGRLKQLFYEADARYDSGLFHFSDEKGRHGIADRLTPALTIDDKPLQDILKRLYYPESPYEFSVLPADILGQVYEQFLGKVIRLTAGHRAVVEDKPEVKKAGGVYYTPTYIVDYIVEHTVGKLLEGKTPKQAAELRILDPACGSGSFLIGAYQRLLDWHRDWYTQHGPDKHRKELYQGRGGAWHLTTAEKKRILTSNIYGVDIDAQAVETTKLSLLLKVLEDETSETIDAQLSFLHERALPDLRANIKCGNSLIGPDFYDDVQLGLAGLDDEERQRINVFDWEAEFPEILGKAVPEEKRGFDAVIGNPPYIRIQNLREHAPREVDFYKRRYVSASKGNYDIYVVFVERGLSLLSQRGLLGYILPHKFMTAKYGEPLRGLLADGRHVSHVVHFGDSQVFTGASTYTAVMVLSRQSVREATVVQVSDLDGWRLARTSSTTDVDTEALRADPWSFVGGEARKVLSRVVACGLPLSEVATRIAQGVITGADRIFLFEMARPIDSGDAVTMVMSSQLGCVVEIESAALKRVVRSGSVGRFHASPSMLALFPYSISGGTARLLTPAQLQEMFPRAWAYLASCKTALSSREKGRFRGDVWYQYSRSQNLGFWEQPKLMLPYMVRRLSAFLDTHEHFYFVNVTTGGYGLTCERDGVSLEYLAGLLNSRLLDWVFRQTATNFRGGYFAANKQYIEHLPICLPTTSADSRDTRFGEVEHVVQRAQKVRARWAEASGHDVALLEREAAALDAHLDRLVYDLYGVTDDEIALVEEAVPSI
jgi:predicted type IV restriction endonuclease